MIVSHHTFMLIVGAQTLVVALAWFVVDLVRLRRDLRAAERNAEWRDRMFGYIIGMACGVIGVAGVLKYHLG